MERMLAQLVERRVESP